MHKRDPRRLKLILLLPDGRWHVCAMQALIIQLCDAPFGLPYSTIMIYYIYIYIFLIIFCIYIYRHLIA